MACIINGYILLSECDSEEDTCYSLVYEEMKELHYKLGNLTESVDELMANDNNSVAGPFSERLANMNTEMQNLTIFVSITLVLLCGIEKVHDLSDV